jgi:aminoglycoside phosphotransferase (APT) family kinase protein
MGLSDPATRMRLSDYIRGAAGAESCEIKDIKRLNGGAIQENHALELKLTGGSYSGRLSIVLRMSAPTGVEDSHGKAAEFALARAAYDSGILVPEPLWCCLDDTVLGKPFCLMERMAGEGRGDVLFADPEVALSKDNIAAQLGRELGKIHAITPRRNHFSFLSAPKNPALAAVAYYRDQLDRRDQAYPALEWGLRWLEQNAPTESEVTLVHRDFRVGNFLIENGALMAILDWEFAGWGDPFEDIGWLFAKCWRFGRFENELGGIADRAPFYTAYEQQSGRKLDAKKIAYWEAYAHVRWAMIALQQTDRYLVGGEMNLDAALSGHRLAELEIEILQMTAPDYAIAS